MLEILYQLDLKIFELINHDFSSSFLDQILPYLTNLHHIGFVQYFLLPLGLIYWLYRSRRKALGVLLALVLVGGVSDLTAYRVIKEHVFRLRPSNDSRVDSKMRLSYGPKSNSFPSNHATNSFAIATTLSWYYPFLSWPTYTLATLIGLSRIYGGVHFPSDVLGGALLGILIARLLIRFIFNRFKFFQA